MLFSSVGSHVFGCLFGRSLQIVFCVVALFAAGLFGITHTFDRLAGDHEIGAQGVDHVLYGTVGIVIGGPLAILIFSFVSPETVGGAGPDAVWRGMTTIAGSWIGGGANQTAMKEVFEVGDQVFSAMIAVDVIVANIWMAVLLYMAGRSKEIDQRVGADTSAIESLRKNVEAFQEKSARIASLTDLMKIAAVGFGMTGLAHLLADWIAPFIKRTAPGLDGFGLTSTFSGLW